METDNLRLNVTTQYESQILRHISLPQCPRQENFWASAEFENTEGTLT